MNSGKAYWGTSRCSVVESKSTRRSTSYKTTRNTYLEYWVWVLQKLQRYFGYFYILYRIGHRAAANDALVFEVI